MDTDPDGNTTQYAYRTRDGTLETATAADGTVTTYLAADSLLVGSNTSGNLARDLWESVAPHACCRRGRRLLGPIGQPND